MNYSGPFSSFCETRYENGLEYLNYRKIMEDQCFRENIFLELFPNLKYKEYIVCQVEIDRLRSKIEPDKNLIKKLRNLFSHRYDDKAEEDIKSSPSFKKIELAGVNLKKLKEINDGFWSILEKIYNITTGHSRLRTKYNSTDEYLASDLIDIMIFGSAWNAHNNFYPHRNKNYLYDHHQARNNYYASQDWQDYIEKHKVKTPDTNL